MDENQGLFGRFTERARQVVILAKEEARTLNHNYIGSEHILLGLLREEEGLAARVLEAMGLQVERVRDRVIEIVGMPDSSGSESQLPFTPRARKILELALREALSLGHNYIGTEHVLLGLSREGDGIAMKILAEMDITDEKIRNDVVRMLSGPGSRQRRTQPDTPLRNGRTMYESWVAALAKALEGQKVESAPVSWEFVPPAEQKAWHTVASTRLQVVPATAGWSRVV